MREFGRLLRYAVPYWRAWTLVLLVTLLSTGLGLLQPWPMQIVIDHILGTVPLPPKLAVVAGLLPGAGSKAGLLAWTAAGGLVIFLAYSLFNIYLTLTWTGVGRRLVYDVAADLFARLQRRSLSFHRSHATGDLLSRVTDDCWAVHTAVDTLLFSPGHAAFAIVATVAVMATMDVKLTLLSLLVAPFMSLTAWRFGKPIRATAHERREIESRIQAHVQQTLAGIPAVQAFAREDWEHRRFQEFASEAVRIHQKTTVVSAFYSFGSGLVSTIGTAVVLWIAAMHVLEGRLTIGTTLVFLAYVATLQGYLSSFTGIYSALQEGSASAERVAEMLDPVDDVSDRPGARAVKNIEGFVRFEQVSFGYDHERPVLHDISFEAAPDQQIAIVGPTGAGKSTLVSLVPRFFDPTSGRVTLDGTDLRDLQISSLRDRVAIVLQEPFLFPITIAENIAYGRPNASRTDIEAAARAANAHLFIDRLPEGYETVLGERGATLSGGERQRLSIARALLKDAPILILDEPTSALDASTEAALLDALGRLMRGRTTFIIAHRLSTIRQADCVLVLDSGHLVESGTHSELLASGGFYARFHDLQFGTRHAAGAR